MCLDGPKALHQHQTCQCQLMLLHSMKRNLTNYFSSKSCFGLIGSSYTPTLKFKPYQNKHNTFVDFLKLQVCFMAKMVFTCLTLFECINAF